ncbi:MAG TPA: hypothetical protein VKB34_10680, partial [Povalibacter sp.]|nr:hypothetical protein [Povalibacter sp.]
RPAGRDPAHRGPRAVAIARGRGRVDLALGRHRVAGRRAAAAAARAVLSAVVGGFVLAAVVAFLYARRMRPNTGIGSVTWFVDAIKLDLDVLARSLAQHRAQFQRPDSEPEPDPEQPERSQVSDAA